MSGDIGLGRVLDDVRSYYRDAVHIAVLPVVAAEQIGPGLRIHVDEHEKAWLSTKDKACNAVADCFIASPVPAGRRFYAMLFPGSITSLRHQWTHPAFPGDALSATQEAEAHLKAFATKIGASLDEVLWRAKDYLKNDEYWTEGSRFEGEYIPDGFWDWYQTYTGEVVPEDKRYSFFSCSC